MTLQNIKISLRTDDLSSWTTSNPVLKYGELAVVNDISAGFTRFKVGDGTSQFNQLPFVNQIKVITDLLEAGEVQAQHISQGTHANSVPLGLAAGYRLSANANYSQAFGFKAQTSASHDFSFTWNGNDEDYTILGNQYYTSHGRGTFNVNPLSGAGGFYIGDESLASMLSSKLEAVDVSMSYDTSSHAILLSSGANVTSVDCADFIKDGMLSTAELCGTILVLSFNADADVQPISVEMSSFADNYDNEISDLSSAIDRKITIDDRISNICQQSDLSIVKLNASDYEELVATSAALSNALYIVEDEFENAYGQQIKNVAPGTDLSDAVTLQQLSDAVSSISIPADLSAFTNSPGYLVSNDISGYYKKTETSSALEISAALSAKADLSSIEHAVLYEQDKDGDYTAVTIGSRRSSLSTDIGLNSFVQGSDCVAVGSYSHAEGLKTVALEDKTHAEGTETSAIIVNSHAEGYSTLAAGAISHAEGSYTSAFGGGSHTEGYGTITNNEGAHAEGGYTSAFGYYSHTEGGFTSTGENAVASHAEGGFTRADGPISHVEGVKATAELSDYQSFVWQGTDVMPNELTDITPSTWNEYKAHGPGTFNINPVSGAAGVYIGEQTLASMLGGGIESIEWADLTSLVQTSALNPGAKYRITDYVTVVDQTDCSSAMHPFDLIVTALTEDQLDENARATMHDGDTYFAAREFHIPAYQDYLEYKRVPLESWQLKYCIKNDKTRFLFADESNGKGVIYWMKDEFGNEAPYDFKNVLFKRYSISAVNGDTSHDVVGMYGLSSDTVEVDESDYQWCYTFNGADYADYGYSKPYDFSGWHVSLTDAMQQMLGSRVERLQYCSGNVIKPLYEDADSMTLESMILPSNVFQCALTVVPDDSLPFLRWGVCLFNEIGYGSYYNTFGNYCYSNTFGNYCYSNTFGNECDSNTFGNYCYSNTFGNECDSNTFGNECDSNTFGNYCYSNTFGNNCIYIKFASTNTSDPSQAKNFYRYITVDGGNQYILLNCTQSTYSGHEYKNVRILPGVNNTTTWKTITDSNVNQSFCTTYQPANSQVIAV